MKKGIWLACTTVAAMMTMYAVTKHIVRGPQIRDLASSAKDHKEKNFNSFPIDTSERDFVDWLS